jgi:ABC-2 type transport system permease protein
VIADIRTVVWKEWRSVWGGRARRQILLTGGMLSVWAVIFPIQMGERFVTDPVMMGIQAIVLPMVVAGIVVPDAIAGERERHTLRTLLASRLPDRSILFGKLGFAVALGWAGSPFLLAIALVITNVVASDRAPLFYDPPMLVGALLLAFLVALFTGAIGIFVSMRAATAQEAQQLTIMGVMLPGMVLGVGATLLFMQRELARQVIDWLGSAEAGYVFVGIVIVIALADAMLLVAADRRFRRSRLSTL